MSTVSPTSQASAQGNGHYQPVSSSKNPSPVTTIILRVLRKITPCIPPKKDTFSVQPSPNEATRVASAVASNFETARNNKTKDLYHKVNKGLKDAIAYCQERNRFYVDEEFSFQETDIPNFAALKPVCDHCLNLRESRTEPKLIKQEKWPCAILTDEERVYFLFDLVIGEEKKPTYLAIDVKTGEVVAISKIERNITEDFDTILIPQCLMDQLEPCFPKEGVGGVLPIKRIINLVSNDEVQTQFVVQKLCKQGDLLTFLNTGIELTAEQVYQIALDVVNAVRILKANNILHRDLKPENIFLNNIMVSNDKHVSERAFVADFDYLISNTEEFQNDPKLKEKIETVGTKAYLSPETILKGDYDHQSEVWGVALILFTLFTYARPRVVDELNNTQDLDTITLADFDKWSPWGQSAPITEGEKLLSDMFNTDPRNRPTIEQVYSRLLAIKPENLQFDYEEAEEEAVLE